MPGAFAKLADDGVELLRVTVAIENIVARSFGTHPMRHMTRAEVKRRFDICAGIFDKLRGDLGWGIVRALDRMPEYFFAELNGSAWTPDTRACWMPEDGRPS